MTGEETRTRLLGRPFALITIGSLSLIFLAAFEAMAVTTIMPIVAADLDGQAWFSVAFSVTLAAGVVGMVVGGSWSDSGGPQRPLVVAIVLFAAGLAVAGTAPVMAVFVAGRFLQGLGAGGITVALYVLVARVLPAALHIRLFGAFASAWVLPSLIGPFLAGLVADVLSWHWVFLGVVVLVGVATALIMPSLVSGHRGDAGGAVRDRQDRVKFDKTQGVRAAAVALAIVALGLSPLLAVPAIVVVAVAARGLLPPGTYRASRGLPSLMLISAGGGAVFFGSEIYLPLLLHDRVGLPAWLSGLTLTTGAVSWAAGSAVQARMGARSGVLPAGAALLAAGALTELLAVGLGLGVVFACAGWVLAGAGMGTLYPQISALVLAWSEPNRQGFNTAAKGIAEAIGGSASVAVTGLVFRALGDSADRAPYLGVFAFTSVIALVVVLLARRAGAPRPDRGAPGQMVRTG